MTDGAAEPIEQPVAPTGKPERKSWWERVKAYWWVTGFSSAFALVHLLDGIGFSREWLRILHAVAMGWEIGMRWVGDFIRAIAPIPIDLAPAELSVLTVYTGLFLPAVIPWLKGDALDHGAFAKAAPSLRRLAQGLAPPVMILAVGMVIVQAIAFCFPGDSVSANPSAVDPTADLPGGWREFGQFYMFGAMLVTIAIWNRPYFRVLVIVGGFLVMLEIFYLVPFVEAALQPFIDAIDPAGATAP